MAESAFLTDKRCLVVDDEFLIALDIQQILESAGARVTVAGGTVQAAEMLRANEPFDLAVLDIKMSEGVDTTTALASLLCEGGVPFVFLTGMRADSTEARNFPRAPVIEKPYQADVLLDALRKVLAAG